jgi:hypothetical protein
MHPALKLLTANSGYLAGASTLNALLRAAYVTLRVTTAPMPTTAPCPITRDLPGPPL